MSVEPARDPREARRVALASAMGTTIEWYDFFIYGTAAALVFGRLFFPAVSDIAGTLAAFATFAVGFLARPLGGVVMGHFGDHIGRKATLVWSLLMMGGATVAIGLLPTYATIGVWAPILLVLLRFVQGFALGGEWGGAALMTVEHAPKGKRGLFGSAVSLGVPAGVIVANLAFLVVGLAMNDDQFDQWGWRVPFLVSTVIVVIGLFLRLRVAESPIFAEARRKHTARRLPVVDVLRYDLRTVLLAAGTYLGVGGLGYIVIVYIVSYATVTLGMSQPTVLWLVIVASAAQGVAIVVSARWSDRVGRRRVWLGGALASLVWAVVFFPLIDTGSVPLVGLAMAGMMFFIGVNLGPQPAVFAELFVTSVRYSGVSLSIQLGTIFGGALVPFVATWLYSATGSSRAVAAYSIVLALITVGCVLGLRETYGTDLSAEADATSVEAKT